MRRAGRVVGIDDLDEPHAGLPGAEDALRVGEGTGAQHVHQEVIGELIVAAGVSGKLFGPSLLGRVDEARAATTRAQRGIDDRTHPGGTVVVEGEVTVVDALGIRPDAEGACLEALIEAALGTLRIELIADRAGEPAEFFGLQLGCFVDQLRGCHRPGLAPLACDLGCTRGLGRIRRM